ncbi:hypothetical protein GEV33_010334 [Tenebrio molitor]|uniref:Uncharacterized protein n=1 Tax=Tenebrio molitor TaxID=7067 RepID=A0A8J6HDL1_TENMO|nr:hypothetical protein GEV33_010334 [Tenebrio molitor]
MAGEIHDSAAWRARVNSGPLTKGLEPATEDPASRAWILEKPRGLRTYNEIVDKIARHCKIRRWSVEDEPHVGHRTVELFKPDLAVQDAGSEGLGIRLHCRVEDENENENNANEDSESSSNISDNHKISDLEATADETDEELIEIRIISEEEETESTSETQL